MRSVKNDNDLNVFIRVCVSFVIFIVTVSVFNVYTEMYFLNKNKNIAVRGIFFKDTILLKEYIKIGNVSFRIGCWSGGDTYARPNVKEEIFVCGK